MSQIKSRLKAAYENVEFHASSTWVNGSNAFQKANQELYVRESKVKDTLVTEPVRPRTVRDCIPQSRLAQYSNYEYSESRELCYASSATDTSFYYPCVCKRGSIKEPWMLPEVEQLFIWFSYTPNFNILELLRLEELAHQEEQEKLRSGRNLTRRWKDFHEISPVFYETFERTPGKPRYTSCAPISQTDLFKFSPLQLKTHTFEDMILRMKILSDKVRDLWSNQSTSTSQPILEESPVSLLMSPLGNYFLLDDYENLRASEERQKLAKKFCTVDDHHLTSADFAQLQSLAESLLTLERLVCNSARQSAALSFASPDHNNYEPPETVSKTEAPPARRLYSAVLQGLPTDKKQPCSTDAASPTNCSVKTQSTSSVSSLSPTKTTSSCFSTENSSNPLLHPPHKSTPIPWKIDHALSENPPSQCLTQSSYWGTAGSPIKSYAQVSQEKKSVPIAFHYTTFKPACPKTETTGTPLNLVNLTSTTTNTPTYSDACLAVNVTHTVPGSPAKTTNLASHSSSNAFLGNTYANNSTCFNSTTSSNNSYINNSYYCNSQYPPHFQTSFSSSIYPNNTYQLNQFPSLSSRHVFPPFNRQPYPSNQSQISSPPSMWVIHHNRPSTLYSVAHFAAQPYLFLPPPPPPPPVAVPLAPRQNQRWAPPSHFVRTPSTLPSYHMPVTLQHTSSSPSPQHWGMQHQNPYRTNSVQSISSSPQQLPEYLFGQSVQIKSKKKSSTATQMGFAQHKARSKSPEDSSLIAENPDNVEISSDTYSNMSMPHSRRSSTGSSDVAFSFPPLDKPLLVKSSASTSSLEFKKIKILSVPKDCGFPDARKRASAMSFGSHSGNANYFSNEVEELHTLPIAPTVSEELERQALEQYQPSDENFYQELERQAEEQYDQDPSENWRGPPNESLLFGGHVIGGVPAATRQCFSFCGVC